MLIIFQHSTHSQCRTWILSCVFRGKDALRGWCQSVQMRVRLKATLVLHLRQLFSRSGRSSTSGVWLFHCPKFCCYNYKTKQKHSDQKQLKASSRFIWLKVPGPLPIAINNQNYLSQVHRPTWQRPLFNCFSRWVWAVSGWHLTLTQTVILINSEKFSNIMKAFNEESLDGWQIQKYLAGLCS